MVDVLDIPVIIMTEMHKLLKINLDRYIISNQYNTCKN